MEESVKGRQKELPYSKKRTEEMWDEIHKEIEKVNSGEIEAPEIPKIKLEPVHIKTPGTLQRLDEMLYGVGGVFEAFGWDLLYTIMST